MSRTLTDHLEHKRARYAGNKVEQAVALAERFSARIYPHGRAWRVVGPTIDMMISDLAQLRESDFHLVAGRPGD